MDLDLYLRGVEEGARREARGAPAPIQARIALRGATIGATLAGADPTRANVSGNVREEAERAALTFAHGCDGKRAEARTPRAPGDGRAWAPQDRAVNGALVRPGQRSRDDSRAGSRTRDLDATHTARHDGAARAAETIERAIRAGAPRGVIRAMRDRAARGFRVEAWAPPAPASRPVVGVYRAP